MESVGRKNQRQHALQRAEERYGLKLSLEEYENISEALDKALTEVRKSISEGRRLEFSNMKLIHLSSRASAWKVDYKGKKMLAIFFHHTKSISTFLPEDTKRIRVK